jgi:hypothetical protein
MSTEFDDALVPRPDAVHHDRFFDRFMLNLHPADATAPSVITGLGHYPARNVVDGFVVVTTGTEQRNVRFSTELSATTGTGAGPLAFEIIEPNRRWRLRVADNPAGVVFDVVWTARTPYWLREVELGNNAGPPTKFEHLVQSGRYRGSMTLDGATHRVDGWYGQRDRSRGVRNMGGGQGLHLWCQAQFPDRSIGFLLVEDRAGERLLAEGAVLHEDGTVDDVVEVRHRLAFSDLDLIAGTVAVRTAAGRVYHLEADASAGGGFMAGAGYGGGHGVRRGRGYLDHEVYRLDGPVSPRTLDTSLTDRLCAFRWGSTEGTGILEFALTRSGSYRYRPTLRWRCP